METQTLEVKIRIKQELEVPAETAWPLVLALGFTLISAGLLTSSAVSVLGAVLAVTGCFGWFREVFPANMKLLYRSDTNIFRPPPNGPQSTACQLHQNKCARGFLFIRTQYRPVSVADWLEAWRWLHLLVSTG